MFGSDDKRIVRYRPNALRLASIFYSALLYDLDLNPDESLAGFYLG